MYMHRVRLVTNKIPLNLRFMALIEFARACVWLGEWEIESAEGMERMHESQNEHSMFPLFSFYDKTIFTKFNVNLAQVCAQKPQTTQMCIRCV